MHGWLILDKPTGITSARAVSVVKRLLKPKKIGHAGTLDPLASGLLPLALGEATKTVAFAMDGRKTYRFTVQFGEERDTDDKEGVVTATSPHRPALTDIESVLGAFKGDVMQEPPVYSAIKVDGERAYAKARAGEEFSLPPRKVHIYDLSVISMDSEDEVTFEMDCGKGTYVRSVARDMARKLGACGHVSMLRRTRVGKFSENHTISLDKLEELRHIGAPDLGMLPVESVLDDIPAIQADFAQMQKLRQGQLLILPPSEAQYEEVKRVMHDGKLVALGKVNAGVFKPQRVFNY